MTTFLSIGAGPGIAFSTGKRFAREGFRVVFGARSTEKTASLVRELEAEGYRASGCIVDAADPMSVAELVAAVESEHGSIDVLHYNAASIRKATLASQSRDTFNSDLAINIGGALAAAQAAVPKMLAKGAGSILLTGGGLALNPNPDFLSLSIGKAGIRAMGQALFEIMKSHNVHVATVTVAALVSPGSKDVELIAERLWQLHIQPKGAWTFEEVYRRS